MKTKLPSLLSERETTMASRDRAADSSVVLISCVSHCSNSSSSVVSKSVLNSFRVVCQCHDLIPLQKPIDPGTLNKLYTRTGYLFLMEKKALGTTWNKYYCHYQRDGRLFCMIPYNQTTPKILSNETFRLKACIKRISESIDKRFCFDIIPEDK